MLGTLCRYLRFMGYDAESAHSMSEGNPREDTLLLRSAEREDRILLTRDRESARRGGSGWFSFQARTSSTRSPCSWNGGSLNRNSG